MPLPPAVLHARWIITVGNECQKWADGVRSVVLKTLPDTVGHPPNAEIWVSKMLSWKAKKLRKLPQEKVLLER
jgi:hypothetical protein